ncbi:MAG: hypothetical protein JW827_05770 [Spirochaetes bacterium]|nr:hypothetical protein [Spirochaetota bacterium]
MKAEIEKILKEEEKGQKSIEQAVLDSEKMKKQADTQAEQHIKDQIEKARQEAKAFLDKARDEFNKERQKELDQAETSSRHDIPRDKKEKLINELFQSFITVR